MICKPIKGLHRLSCCAIDHFDVSKVCRRGYWLSLRVFPPVKGTKLITCKCLALGKVENYSRRIRSPRLYLVLFPPSSRIPDLKLDRLASNSGWWLVTYSQVD